MSMQAPTGDFGIAFARDRKSMQDHDWQNDSRMKKWVINLDADPTHLDVLEAFPGGTKLTQTSANNGQIFTETLFKIEHGIKEFIPAFEAYFYIQDAPIAFAGIIGFYNVNYFIMQTGTPIGTEIIWAEIDDTFFYIKHRVSTGDISFYDPGGYTWTGSDYKFRIRYEIFNHEAYFTSGAI